MDSAETRTKAIQLDLLAPWYANDYDQSRTLDFYDVIPKYPYAKTRVVKSPDPVTAKLVQ